MSVLHAEVAKFNALAAGWWDPDGPMRPLHRMNPARVAWIVERTGTMTSPPPLAGVDRGERGAAGLRPPPPNPLPQGKGQKLGRLLDVGCGAGLASEAFARCGFCVLGIDAAGGAIEAARYVCRLDRCFNLIAARGTAGVGFAQQALSQHDL